VQRDLESPARHPQEKTGDRPTVAPRIVLAKFTPGPAALRNKTYPPRIILGALTDYNLGYSLNTTAARLQKKANRTVSASPICAWLDEHKPHKLPAPAHRGPHFGSRCRGLYAISSSTTHGSTGSRTTRAKLDFLRHGQLDERRAGSVGSTACFAKLTDFLETIPDRADTAVCQLQTWTASLCSSADDPEQTSTELLRRAATPYGAQTRHF
jgi:hypothetical protein